MSNGELQGARAEGRKKTSYERTEEGVLNHINTIFRRFSGPVG